MSQEDRVERLMRFGSRLWIAKYRLRRVRNSPASRASGYNIFADVGMLFVALVQKPGQATITKKNSRWEGQMNKVGLALAAVLLAYSSTAFAEFDRVKIGVLTDLSGFYESGAGNGSVEAAKMAVEEFGGKVNGKPIEVIAGDHQNKPDVGATIANRWYDLDKVDLITEVVNSAVAFAVLDITKQKNKMVILDGAGSADFTGKLCAPDNSIHWVYDTYELGAAVGATAGLLGKKWFFISADYAFGAALEAGLRPMLLKNGAEILGAVKHPLGNMDFSSYVLQAQAANPDVIALNSGGDDTIGALKAIREFGIKAKVMGFGLDSPTGVRAMGLQVAQGPTTLLPGRGAMTIPRPRPGSQNSSNAVRFFRARSKSALIRVCAAT